MTPLKHLRPRVWWIDETSFECFECRAPIIADKSLDKSTKVHDSAYVELLERIVRAQSEVIKRKCDCEFIACKHEWFRQAELAESAVQQMCEEFGRG